MKVFQDKKVLKTCHIYQMLKGQKRKHISFHTPGHKQRGMDITELSYSDNLSSPKGCILQAEKDITQIVGANRSFLLTDGSTSGILSMLYAAKTLGVKSVCFSSSSHKSVLNGCSLLEITPLIFQQPTKENIPLPLTMYALNEDFYQTFEKSDALLLTYPDYYGNVFPLSYFRKLCDEKGKLLLIDGAHGSHLHFNKELYAGSFADMWVDGAHKNLPTLTQGAVVSAKTPPLSQALQKGVDVFRTTSPSYPIMASVEYGMKYRQNTLLEQRAAEFLQENERIYFGGDWTKVCVLFGASAFEAEKEAQRRGIYPEFCDGNVLLFYLSPATKKRHFTLLKKTIAHLVKKFPYQPIEEKERVFSPIKGKTEWIAISSAIERICALNCGLFPPCVPLLRQGEKITQEKIRLLEKADNVFGVYQEKICVYKEE